MTLKVETDHYIAHVTITFDECNSFGDKIDSGVLHVAKKVRVNKLAGLTYLLTQLDEAFTNIKQTQA